MFIIYGSNFKWFIKMLVLISTKTNWFPSLIRGRICNAKWSLITVSCDHNVSRNPLFIFHIVSTEDYSDCLLSSIFASKSVFFLQLTRQTCGPRKRLAGMMMWTKSEWQTPTPALGHLRPDRTWLQAAGTNTGTGTCKQTPLTSLCMDVHIIEVSWELTEFAAIW